MTAVENPGVRYVWSRFAPNAVEHIAGPPPATRPICGAWLSPERMYYTDHPSGLAPLCQRCQRKASALPETSGR